MIDVPLLVDDEGSVLVERLFGLCAELLADPHGRSEQTLPRRGLPVVGQVTSAGSTLADADAMVWHESVFVNLVPYFGGKREEGETDRGSGKVIRRRRRRRRRRWWC